MLTRIIYCSVANEQTTYENVKQIWRTATDFNAKNAITGILFFNSRRFLQCLEGERQTVNQLYLNIAKDPRHKHLEIIEAVDVLNRNFPDWSMHLIAQTEANKEKFLKFMGSSEFKPELMTGDEALRFLQRAIPLG